LDRRLFIYPGDLYSRTNTIETQRQMANLDMFKFINIYYDTTGGKFAANIFTSPLKKFQTTNELGLGIILSQGFPGPFYNFSLKNRNVFGGFEIMEITGRVGIEGVPAVSDTRDVYSSTEASANFSLIFPQFVLPLSSRLKSRLGGLNPKTRVVAGYSFTNRPEYERSTFNGSFGYSWQIQERINYVLTLSDLNLIYSPRLDPAFVDYLEELEFSGNNLINTFNTSFVSSINFAATFNFNQYGLANQKASLLKIAAESGGTSLNVFSPAILDSLGLEYYQFLKFNFDYRQYFPLRKNSLAYRIHLGIAYPYGDNNILPYEKYFFAGGSNGIRAWRPRRLGPGSYTPLDSAGSYDDRFEQPAEIILETSIELRRKLLAFVDGALFMDAGNSWTFREETLRPNAEFRFNRFYEEIAVGAGAGLRLDFSFLLVRFDLGLKVHDPARPKGKRFIFQNGFNDKPFSQADNYVLNIGIGYPF
jgi:outer membrane protein assembly factor BamA